MRAVLRRLEPLRPPPELLGRLRWFFLGFGLFFLVTFLPQITLQSPRPPGLKGAAIVLMTALGAWWLRCYRRGVFPLPGLVLESAAFLATALAADDPFKALGLLYISVNFRALYGSWRRVAGFTALAVVTFLVGLLVARGLLGAEDRLPQFWQSVPGVPVLAAIAHLISIASERSERAAARERVLSRSGLMIALAVDEEGVREEGVKAADQLLVGVPGARVQLLPRLQVCDTPPAAARASLPLRTRDSDLGVLVVDSPRELPEEVHDGLDVLRTQIALGLENITLTGDLRHRATHDPLTNLANRRVVDERIALALARGNAPMLAVLLLDLDGFKAINDTLGHAAGDDLLVAVAARLRSAVRDGDVVARLGGDEFVVLLETLEDSAEAARLAQRIVTTVADPIDLGGRSVRVGVSVGVAVREGHPTPAELMRDADTAMYEAKRAGKVRSADALAGTGGVVVRTTSC